MSWKAAKIKYPPLYLVLYATAIGVLQSFDTYMYLD